MATNIGTLAEAIVSLKLDDSQLKKQINAATAQLKKIGDSLNKTANNIFKYALAPMLAIGTLGVRKFMQTTESSAGHLNASILRLRYAFDQFLARVGKVLVEKFHLAEVIDKIASALERISPETIEKLVKAFAALALVFVSLKGLSFILTAMDKLAKIPTGVLTGIGKVGGAVAAPVGVILAMVSAYNLAINKANEFKRVQDAGVSKMHSTIMGFGQAIEGLPIVGKLFEWARMLSGGKDWGVGKDGNKKMNFMAEGSVSSGGFAGLNKVFQDYYNQNQLNNTLEDNSSATRENTQAVTVLSSALAGFGAGAGGILGGITSLFAPSSQISAGAR